MKLSIKCTLLLLLFAVSAQAQNLFWFIENKQVGFADKQGKVIIKPQFAMAGNFNENITFAGIGEGLFTAKYGFINKTGAWVIQPQFDAADEFSEGKARVLQGGKWGFINLKGNMVISPQFRLCYPFKNGYAKATTDNKTWGLIDTTGKFVLAPAYYSLVDMDKNGVLAVNTTLQTKWKLVNIKGEPVNDKEFGLIRNFSEGLAAARNENNQWGFINTAGDWVIEPKYSDAHLFSDGLAAVEIDFANWGFIDKNNSLIIKPAYDRAAIFINGFAKVEKGNEYLYIDKSGYVILKYPK